jgi:hypothetical protein
MIDFEEKLIVDRVYQISDGFRFDRSMGKMKAHAKCWRSLVRSLRDCIL